MRLFFSVQPSLPVHILDRNNRQSKYLKFFFLRQILLSLRLTGVETLGSVSQNFKRKFHFLFLVSVAMDKLTAR